MLPIDWKISRVSEKELHPYEKSLTYSNFFNIRDSRELFKKESVCASLASASLFSSFYNEVFSLEDGFVMQNLYSFNCYSLIHHYLFSEIYPWAGQVRDFDMVFEGHVFTNSERLVFYGNLVLNEFREKIESNYFWDKETGFLKPDEFVFESARFLNHLNILHPFPDGNGRTQRVLFELHLNYHGLSLDWPSLHQWEIYEVMKQAFEGDIDPLIGILEKNINLLDNGQKECLK